MVHRIYRERSNIVVIVFGVGTTGRRSHQDNTCGDTCFPVYNVGVRVDVACPLTSSKQQAEQLADALSTDRTLDRKVDTITMTRRRESRGRVVNTWKAPEARKLDCHYIHLQRKRPGHNAPEIAKICLFLQGRSSTSNPLFWPSQRVSKHILMKPEPSLPALKQRW